MPWCSEHGLNTCTTCTQCASHRPLTDMAWVNADPYCHPAWSDGETCYMRAQRGMGK